MPGVFAIPNRQTIVPNEVAWRGDTSRTSLSVATASAKMRRWLYTLNLCLIHSRGYHDSIPWSAVSEPASSVP